MVRNDSEVDRVGHRPIDTPADKGLGDLLSNLGGNVGIPLQESQCTKQESQIGWKQNELTGNRLLCDRLPGHHGCRLFGGKRPIQKGKAHQKVRPVQEQTNEGPPDGSVWLVVIVRRFRATIGRRLFSLDQDLGARVSNPHDGSGLETRSECVCEHVVVVVVVVAAAAAVSKYYAFEVVTFSLAQCTRWTISVWLEQRSLLQYRKFSFLFCSIY